MTKNNDHHIFWKQIFLCVLVIIASVAYPDIVFAQTATMASVMCNAALALVLGQPVELAIATIGMCSIGVGACFGRVSWPTALMVCAGIAGMTGAWVIAANIAEVGPGGLGCFSAPSS